MKKKWHNLELDKCPMCGREIFEVENGSECSNSVCNFFITRERKNEIIDSFNREEYKKELDGYGFE